MYLFDNKCMRSMAANLRVSRISQRSEYLTELETVLINVISHLSWKHGIKVGHEKEKSCRR